MYQQTEKENLYLDFLDKLKSDKRFISLEITPPHGVGFDKLLDDIQTHNLNFLVDAYSVTDSPLAKLKMSALVASKALQDKFGKAVMTTMSMRDQNKIALQSTLLGANYLDVRLFLSLTGDHAKYSDQPDTKNVMEGRSSLFMDMIKCFNNGIDYAGKEFKSKPKPIYSIAVSNSYAKNFNNLKKRLVSKLNSGVKAIVTQPVFDLENANNLLNLFEEAKVEAKYCDMDAILILGFFPITKLKTAQFLSSHVPGIHVKKEWMQKLENTKDEYKVGFDLSKVLLDDLIKLHPKIHVMTANKFELAKELLK